MTTATKNTSSISNSLVLPPIYNNTTANMFDNVINGIKTAWNYISYYVSNNMLETIFILALIIYCILVTLFFSKNPYDIINGENGGTSIVIALLGGFSIVLMFIFYKQKKQILDTNETANGTSFIGKVFSILLYTVLFVGLYYGIFIFGSHYYNFTSICMYIINILIVISLLTIILKYFIHDINEPADKSKPAWIQYIITTITYIPQHILEFIDYVKLQYDITTRPIIILLVVEIILIASYFILPWGMNHIMTHDASQLLQTPINLNKNTHLGTFKDINFVNEHFNYHYAISAWVFIDSFPPETNPNYDEYTSILNIGDKPNILFNVRKHKLKIKLTTQGHNELVLFETTQFKLQKWNNIVINYDGSTLDIFINNELVSTTPGVIPYNANTIITSGTVNGILGGICNVMYYKNSLSRSKINWIYDSVKQLNPPLI